jgi:glycosyltransferase involved in cell wall biosynthesis
MAYRPDGPLVSVVIPVYNGERYLAEAIESVLGQPYRPLELLVVDDGSADGSAEVAGRYDTPVRLIRALHEGAAAARNRGAEAAEGSYLAFLDADDLWTAGKLPLQVARLESDAALDAAFGTVEHFYSPELDQAARNTIECPGGAMPAYHPGAMLIRTEAFRRVGPFQTCWQVGEFMDWYLRAQEAGLMSVMLPDVVMRRRLHGANLGLRARPARVDYARILKAALDRRRKNGCTDA